MKSRHLGLALVLVSTVGCGDTGTSVAPNARVSVSVSGTISRVGQPLDSVAVSLSAIHCPFQILLCGFWESQTVVTEANGRYVITDRAPTSLCDFVRLSVVNRRYPESESLSISLNRCGSHTVNHDFKTRLVVTPVSASILMGATQQFIATDSAGTILGGVAWSSNQVRVATVDPLTGLATGVHFGTSSITAKSNGMIGTCMEMSSRELNSFDQPNREGLPWTLRLPRSMHREGGSDERHHRRPGARSG